MLTNKKITDWLVLPIWYVLDRLIKKQDYYWGFPVHYSDSKKFIENTRAVFEHVKKDASIKKILFYRDNFTDFQIDEAENFELVKLQSFRGLFLLMQCRVLFLANAMTWDFTLRWNNDTTYSIVKMNMKRRKVVNLSHGIPLKKIFSLWNKELKARYNRIKYRTYERANYFGLTTSSKVDSYVMAAMYYPIKYENVVISGLPRNDFLLQTDKERPRYFLNQLEKIRELKAGRKLILYAPTHRQTAAVSGSVYYDFSDEDVIKLKAMLKKHNAILGIRMHYLRKGTSQFSAEAMIDNEYVFDLGNSLVPEIGPCIIESDAIITDYSSLYIDGLYINKPVFSFAYDLEHYRDSQDGLVYDLDFAFPGPILKEFPLLVDSIDAELTKPNQHRLKKYKFLRTMFFEYIDTNNSKRIVAHIKEALRNE